MLCIIGLIMGGVAIVSGNALVPAREQTARDRAMSLYEAVEMYQLAHAGKCPGDLEALAKRRMIRNVPKDPWDVPYQLECEG